MTGPSLKVITCLQMFEERLDKYGPVGLAARFAKLDLKDAPDQMESNRRELVEMLMKAYDITDEQIEEYICKQLHPAAQTA